jgi:hypothetical protein
MIEPQSDAPVSKRAIWGLVLVGLALPLTFIPSFWGALQGEGVSSYTITALIAVPVGTAGLLLALLAASDIRQSEGHLRGWGIAITAIVLGAIGAAAATPLVLAALF